MARSIAADLSADALIGEEPIVDGEQAPTESTETSTAPESEAPPTTAEEPPVEPETPPVEVEAEAETPPTEEEEPPAEKPTGKFPWQELRKAQREREELATRIAQMEHAQAQAARAAQQPPPPAPGEQRPGIDRPYTQVELTELRSTDPIEYAAVVAEQSQRMALAQEQRQQMMMVQQMVARQVDEYKAEHPDYTEAARYAGERERAAWVAVGLPETAPPHQPRPDGACCADHMVEARTAMLINQSLSLGKNVAENVMAVAKAYGWQGNGNGKAKEEMPAVKELTPTEKVAISKAKSAAAMGSVGNIPSGPTKSRTRITKDEYMAMNEAETDRRDKEDPNWMDNIEF